MINTENHKKSLINTERRDKALHYLLETDQLCADLKTAVVRAEYKAKRVKDNIFLYAQGSVQARLSFAGNSDEYEAAMDEYFAALAEFEAIRNKRATEVLVIEAWRSENANRRVGNL